MRAFIGASLRPARRPSAAPSLHGHYPASSVLWAAPTPAPLSPTSSGTPLIGFVAPSPPVGWLSHVVSLLGRRRVSPVPTTAFPSFHALYAAGFFGAALPSSSHLPWPSPGTTRLGSRLSPYRETLTTRQASLHVADRWFAPSQGGLDPALPTPGSPRTTAGCYEGVLVPPSARLSLASRRELPGRKLPPTMLRAELSGWGECRSGSAGVSPALVSGLDDRRGGQDARAPG